MDIGRRIAIIRKEKRLTQKELAEKAGISANYLRRIETGKCPAHQIKLVSRIADALGVDLNELYKDV